jgi:hypothetical protein
MGFLQEPHGVTSQKTPFFKVFLVLEEIRTEFYFDISPACHSTDRDINCMLQSCKFKVIMINKIHTLIPDAFSKYE